jgi:oligopeptide transport system permease protein
MIRYFCKRILAMIPVLFIIAAVTFAMIKKVPGGPFDREKKTTPEIKKMMEEQYGLNVSGVEQFKTYLKKALTGDLGPSYRYANWSVKELIAASFPVSLELGLWALCIAMTIGLTAGLLAAMKPNSTGDHLPMSMAMVGICLPTFVMGPLLIGVFALWLNWYNSSGWDFPQDRVLPALTLGLYYAAYVARLTRGGMLEMLSQDFIRTARAKGASPKRVILGHSLKGGLLPVISFLGPATAGLITGSFVVEKIFDIPGLGRFFINSVSNRDGMMIMGTVLFYGVLIQVMNLVVDLIQVWLNPKLRLE